MTKSAFDAIILILRESDQEELKTTFLPLFFQNLAAVLAENFVIIWSLLYFKRARKISLIELKN